jgi:ligand-binding sensor domain-containing protein
MITRIYILLCVLVLSTSAHAQKYLFEHFGTDKGLIQSDINDITQDNAGNIWIGTNAGVSVFDGKSFKNFDDLSQLSNLRITRIRCDRRGLVWVSTDDALLTYNGSFSVVFKSRVKGPNKITAFTIDQNDNKYFIYDWKVHIIRQGSKTPERLLLGTDDDTSITAFNVDSLGNYWVGTLKGSVYRMKGRSISKLACPLEPAPTGKKSSNVNVFSIRMSSLGFPHFISNKGILIPANDSILPLTRLFPELPHMVQMYSLTPDGDEAVWLGTSNGAFRLTRRAGIKHYNKSNGLYDHAVMCVYKDSENNWWFGTNGNGLFRLSNRNISVFDETVDNMLVNVESIEPINNGRILLGSYGSGLLLKSGTEFRRLDVPSDLFAVRNITSLVQKNGTVFVSTFGTGVWDFDTRTETFSKSRLALPESFINGMTEIGEGLVTYSNSRYITVFDGSMKVKARQQIYHVQSLFAYQDTMLLFTRNNGTELYDMNLKLLSPNPFPEIQSRISCVEYINGYVVLGTIGQGLMLYDNNRKFIRKLDSRSNIIYSLKLVDDQLFVGSNLGFTRSTVQNVGTISRLDESIIFNGECKEEGILQVDEDTLLVSSTKGLFVVGTRDEARNTSNSTLSLTGLRFISDNRTTLVAISNENNMGDITVMSKIPCGRNSVEINLKGISQVSSRHLDYKFRLENYEDKWNRTSNVDLIRYTNLAPGAYVFRATAGGNGSLSNTLTIRFTIDAPLKARWWFQLMVAVIFVLLAALLLYALNKFNQRFLQTLFLRKSVDALSEKKRKLQTVIDNTRTELTDFRKELPQAASKNGSSKPNAPELLSFLIDTTIARLQVIWEQEHLSVPELHQQTEKFMTTNYGARIHVSHVITPEVVRVPVDKAEKVLKLFWAYMFYSYQLRSAAQFSLTSKLRLGNQLFFKLYSTSGDMNGGEQQATLLESYVSQMHNANFSIEYIKSQNLGNMIILTIPLETNELITAVEA